jgi:hypothetical protein
MTPAPWRWGTVTNAVRPDQLTSAERLNELAEVLAVGLMRLRARKSSQLSPHTGESSLDCPGHRSGHGDVLRNGGRE